MSGKHRAKPKFVSRHRAPVGAPPGTLIPDDRASPTGIRLTIIADDHVEEIANAPLSLVEKEMQAGRRLWVDVTGLADLELLGRVGSLFSIQELALEDIANTNQRPKVDTYETHALIVVHMFDGKGVESKEQFSILFDGQHVVTFQERPGDCLDPVRKRLQQPQGRIRKRGAPYLVYAILDTILDAYFPMLEVIGDELEELEDKITKDPHPEDVGRLHELKRELLVIKRALWPSREMLSAMSREELGLIPRDVGYFLRDTYDHAIQLIDIVETYRELATGLLDLYLSSVSTRMNEVMKVLTIISTIFIPLSFLAGIWGMNFAPDSSWNMPELRWRYGYPVALTFMVLIAVGLLYLFRRKRWL
ncbi:magnesium/cobalt transporter CorA [Nitratireductor mangrovi]|uniref:Magnesium transport protein CorA n=1 Tax=Nitratireductor mangrovi TaxID=2599600 RepID=A0A5B8KZT5_9HYPH|nr:magnesium/cobalt transporter CorA [Nitratireductor mangrovi]QDZ01274.2 magnesium/cobalt transporter CorA [Nitratireductor mangrovi]